MNTEGATPGETITKNVNPITTVISEVLLQEELSSRTSREIQLLNDLGVENSNISLLANAATEAFRAFRENDINVDFGSADDGEDGDDGASDGSDGVTDNGSIEGVVGVGERNAVFDDANESMLAGASCNFALSPDGPSLVNTILQDVFDDGLINLDNRPDLGDLANPVFHPDSAAISQAFLNLFPNGIGFPYIGITNDAGIYNLPIPPNLPGFVRCAPLSSDTTVSNMQIGAYTPGREINQKLENEDVTPERTVFVNQIADNLLTEDVSETYANYLDDIRGLQIRVDRTDGEVTGFKVAGVSTQAAVGLAAFAATATYITLLSDMVNVDFNMVLDNLFQKRMVDSADLVDLGLPQEQSERFAQVINDSVQTAGPDLENNTLDTSLTTVRILVQVLDGLGRGKPDVEIDIPDLGDIQCMNCRDITDGSGSLQLTLTNVLNSTQLTIEAKEPGQPTMRTTVQISPLATLTEIIRASTPTFMLTVTRQGQGRVSSDPGGIDCGSDCEQSFDEGTPVTLSANADSGWEFVRWEGCSSSSSQCTLTMDRDHNVTAVFQEIQPPTPRTLRVNREGSGRVTSNPGGIDCGSDCDEDYEEGEQVTLSANADDGWEFDRWEGCSGSGNQCTVTMDRDRTVTAVFVRVTRTYTLRVNREGSGRVTSDPSGINCGSDCNQDYDEDTRVTLRANPDDGWEFDRWEGCSGSGNQCTVTMDRDRTVTAIFKRVIRTYTLRVNREGSGRVTSDPSGINCGSDCSQEYDEDTRVTLRANADDGWEFDRWEGCSGSGNQCTVTMDRDRTVTAIFKRVVRTYTLRVNREGSGRVTSDPSGINCGSDCSQEYDEDTRVELRANADSGWMFDRWEGCSGSGNQCRVTMDRDRTVTAIFKRVVVRHTLQVRREGNGRVTSDPGGINCGSDCEQDYEEDTRVELRANADDGWEFDRWEGCSSSNNRCTVTMDRDRTVTAIFTRAATAELRVVNRTSLSIVELNVSPNSSWGPNQLRDRTIPPGGTFRLTDIPCPENYNLRAIFSDGQTLTRRNVRFNCNQTVTWTFTQAQRYTLRVNREGNGRVTSDPGGINCGSDCSQEYDEDTRVELRANADDGWEFDRWEGCSSSNNRCTVTMDRDRTVTAIFSRETGGGGGSAELRVVNRTSLSIVELNVSPVSSSSWGPNQLRDRTIPPGGTFRLTNIPCPENYDLRAIFSSGQRLERRNIRFNCNQTVTWTFTQG